MPKLYQSLQDEKYYISVHHKGEGIVGRIVDSTGIRMKQGMLFTITPGGKMTLCGCVDETAARKAGIQLDSKGRIKNNLIRRDYYE